MYCVCKIIRNSFVNQYVKRYSKDFLELGRKLLKVRIKSSLNAQIIVKSRDPPFPTIKKIRTTLFARKAGEQFSAVLTKSQCSLEGWKRSSRLFSFYASPRTAAFYYPRPE